MNPNKEAIREWVNALRSDKYTQAKHALQTEEGYCCLGVACDLYNKKHNIKEPVSNYNDALKSVLPEEIAKYYGIKHNPDVACKEEPGYINTLTYLNDIDGLSFKSIANAIEDAYLK